MPLDLLAYDTHEAKVAQVLSRFGTIDVLVNNAGRSQRALAERTSLQVGKEKQRKEQSELE